MVGHNTTLRIGIVSSVITGLGLLTSWWVVTHPDPDVVGADIGMGILTLAMMMLFGVSVLLTILGLLYWWFERRERRAGRQ